MSKDNHIFLEQVIYRKVESSMTELLEAKNRLAYEKGQLHQRLEALQRELEATTKVQTENKHLKKMKTSLESQVKKVGYADIVLRLNVP